MDYRNTRRRQREGAADINFNQATVIGAGGYGIILLFENQKRVFKLFYDLNERINLRREASIQQQLHMLFKIHFPEVRVPQVYRIFTDPVIYNNTTYLCGIEMEWLEPPRGFTEAVHMLLGYNGDDIDTEWGRTVSAPVSDNNPTRGFFASPQTLELIWEDEGSDMTVERLSALMGKALQKIIHNGIIPADIEWVWSNGHPYIIDFGLCRFDTVYHATLLHKKGLYGLADDFYIPHKGHRGYHEFLAEFMHDGSACGA